jgi:hypothetical protein
VPRVTTDLDLFAYPDLLAKPNGIDDINRLWFYPDGFDAAGMQVWHGDGPALPASSGTAGWRHLGRVTKGVPVRVTFVTKIPERQGSFGRRHGVAYLLGGWYPRFAHRHAAGAQPDAVRLTYSVEVPAEQVGFVGRAPYGRTSARTLAGVFDGGTLPVLVAPGAHVHRQPGAVLLVPEDGRGHAPDGGDLFDGRNATAENDILATIRQGSQMATHWGLTPQSLITVVAPLRAQLAEPFAGGVAVSDRAFHVLPVERMKKFHRASIWHVQFAALATPAAKQREAALAPAVAADAVGVGLTDLLLEQYGAREYAPDILERFALSPEVDNLIFAPQAPFTDTYYRAIDDRLVSRWRPEILASPAAHGGLLYAKLADRVGTQEAHAHTLAYLRGNQPWLQAVGERFGADKQAAIHAWLGPYPQVDYSLDVTASGPSATDINIGVAGPGRGVAIEPLDVAVTDAQGMRHEASRLGPGPLRFAVPGPIRAAQLDPHGHLVQLWHPPGKDARFNDGTPHRMRLLLNDIGGVIAATNVQISAYANVSLRRLHDLRTLGLFGGTISPYVISASASGIYNFGAALTPLRLAQSVGATLDYTYLRPGNNAPEPGHQLGLALSYLYDDRLSRFSSYEGHGLNAQAAAGLTFLSGHDVQPFYAVGAAALHIWPIAYGHGLLGRVRGDATFGAVPTQSQLRLGGRYLGARGFESNEQTARRRVLASAEYRHVLWGDGRTDLFGALMLTRLEGALFADAVYLPGAQPRCGHAMFYDVGYSFRLLGDNLGVSPIAIALDVGIPLNRCNSAGRLPFTIYLAFVQSFLLF